MTDSGKVYLSIKNLVIDGEYEGKPMDIVLFYESEMGMNHLKGIINRVDPELHQVGTVQDAIKGLESKMLGGVFQLRHSTTVSKKDGKTYKNVWFHEVINLAAPGFTTELLREDDIPF